MNESRLSVAAVVVTFFPDEGLAERLAAIARECARVIVVDNGSGEASRARITGERIELIALGENCGIAAALNIGLGRAVELGYGWAVTFDQDSTPDPGMVAALWRTRQGAAVPERVALVGPRLSDEHLTHNEHRWVVPHPRCRWWFLRVACEGHDLFGVAFVITSGALTDLRIWREIGGMDEGLFIDYVDHDYCLRARKAGYEVGVSAAGVLRHNLGAKREFMVTGHVVRPTFHAALRLRYMARNRWMMWRRYARDFPHWAAYDEVHSIYKWLRTLAYEDGRSGKLAAGMRGTWDGMRGKCGRIL